MFEHILVTLDGSRVSLRALPYAVEIARRFNSEITLLRIVRPAPLTPRTSPIGGPMTSGAELTFLVQTRQEQDAHNTTQAQRYLKSHVNRLQADGITASSAVVTGDPAEMIIRFCKQENIDLVIMTSSGKSGIKRAILGSVADRVVREPGFPVMVIRPVKSKRK